ncbi:hypothetical protein N7466_005615 [Penicillium verhagenii]|uniref:uncharacterized protein n=1 Tax=Penicillium verhagenii TaxID=1562060 RepID=UPI0025457646|nr:uncharacterized protein N7466_005615 [Penicillium verhagenii]KAJ5930122.1 hypothetical protein N7466_005615 [Penicillium verhagenii]
MRFLAATLFFGAVLAEPSMSVMLKHTDGNVADYPAKCYPDPCKGITYVNETAVCGDPRLGPIELPKYFPLSTEVQTYHRFGDLCPYEFLEKYSLNVSDPNAYFIYPGAGGFANTTDQKPISGTATLVVGQKVDRFGEETGTYLAPLGAPYIERGLPPKNLFAPKNSSYPYNYHVYEVVEPIEVSLGPVAAWFEQPGLGTQFVLLNGDTVGSLVGHKLKILEKKEYDQASDFAANYLPTPPHKA